MTDATNWMQETFTPAEKRDEAMQQASALGLVLSNEQARTKRPGPVRRQQWDHMARSIALLRAIAADYDFKVRQGELSLG